MLLFTIQTGIRARKSTKFGDQYVHFNVSIPA